MHYRDLEQTVLIPQDKANHAIYGALAALAAAALVWQPWAAVVAAAALGAAKETADHLFGGDVSAADAAADAAATAAGGVVVAVAMALGG